MNRRPRPTRSTQQVISYSKALKKIRRIQKVVESRDKQLSDTKKILQGAKKSYDSVVKENIELKNTLKI